VPGVFRFVTVPGMDWDQNVVWITTRTIKPGTYEEFRKAWRPRDFPDGMLRAYECFSEDRNEVVGISVWDSFESRERYRLSDVEAERQRAMAPFVEAERSGIYVGRELEIPKD
jgi:heme-degrading monooxygenase HmoA